MQTDEVVTVFLACLLVAAVVGIVALVVDLLDLEHTVLGWTAIGIALVGAISGALWYFRRR